MLLLQKHNHLFISLLFKNSLTADSSETINKYANNELITCVGVSFSICIHILKITRSLCFD